MRDVRTDGRSPRQRRRSARSTSSANVLRAGGRPPRARRGRGRACRCRPVRRGRFVLATHRAGARGRGGGRRRARARAPPSRPRRADPRDRPRGVAKTLETCDRLWRELRLERSGALVAVGGGSTTDVAGFVASAYLRGIDWTAVPTTLLGQVDAAIGGKTAIDLPEGKNLVGAFHWPRSTVVDPALLQTLPEDERRNGLAEVVKTGLLMDEEVWELSDADLVRRCAAFKSAVCLRDPHDLGERRMLNLGHTFAHALEAASDYALPHGQAVALRADGRARALGARGAEGARRGGARAGSGAGGRRSRLGGASPRQEGGGGTGKARAAREARAAGDRRRASGRRRAKGARQPHRVGSGPCESRC